MADTETILKATAQEIQQELAKYPTIDMGKKGEYLEVKYRVKVFRQHYPDASYHTYLAKLDGDRAVVGCSIYPNQAEWPEWHADGLAMHSATDRIADAVANAETSAIGRALEKLGYGTGSSFEEPKGDDGKVLQMADAPFPKPTAAKPTPIRPPAQQPQRQPEKTTPAGNPATTKQIGTIKAILCNEFPGDDGRPDWRSISKWTGRIDDREGNVYLTVRQASYVIDYLKRREADGLVGTGELDLFSDVTSGKFAPEEEEDPWR